MGQDAHRHRQPGRAKDYDWALLTLKEDDAPNQHPGTSHDTSHEDDAGGSVEHPRGHSLLLIRRHRYTRELAFFRCWTTEPVPLSDLVAVVCNRWNIETDFQLAKRSTGLDAGQVRTWTSWHRWSTASLTAYAFLAIAALLEHVAPQATGEDLIDLVPISVLELQHLLTGTVLPAPTPRSGPRPALVTLATPPPSPRPPMPPSLETPTPTRSHDHTLKMITTKYNCRDCPLSPFQPP